MNNRCGCNNSYTGALFPVANTGAVYPTCQPPGPEYFGPRPEDQCQNLVNVGFLPCEDQSVNSMGFAAAVIEYTNRLRENMGRTRLVPDTGLTIGAQYKANDMVQRAYWGHFDPQGGGGAAAIADLLGQNDSRIWTDCIAENIAAHSLIPTPWQAFAQWFCSANPTDPAHPKHFEAMVNPAYDRIGVGFAPAPNFPDPNIRNIWVMWLASSTNQFRWSCGPNPPQNQGGGGGTPQCQTGWRQENGGWAYYQSDCTKQTGYVQGNETNAMKQALNIGAYGTTHNQYWIDPNSTNKVWSEGWVWNGVDYAWWYYVASNRTWWKQQCDRITQTCPGTWQQQSGGPMS